MRQRSCSLFLLCALVLFSACAPIPDFHTSNGTAVFNNTIAPITRELMDDAENCLIPCLNQLSFNLDSILNMLPQVKVYWEDSLYYNNHPVAGLTNYNVTWIVWPGSIRKSAYFHEMLHVAQMMLWGYWDYTHEDSSWKTFGECTTNCDLLGD